MGAEWINSILFLLYSYTDQQGIMSYVLYASKLTHGIMGDYRLFELNCVRNFMWSGFHF